ncbi:MAG: thiamine-phosphate kinase [Chloroflexota bacterium]|nr:thiamine-phosphate kinase [Chloroflexota bacterium]
MDADAAAPHPPETVAALGEFALIARLAGVLAETGAAAAPDLLGIGDDAAVWMPTPGTRGVITVDSLIADVHFRLDWTGPRDLGHKALAVNLSDIAAMGARPRLAVVSLGLTGGERVAWVLDLYRGLGALAARYGVVVAGGDIVAAPDRLGLHVTVVGESWPEAGGRVLRRDGARPGDLIAVSGPLGLSAAGLRLLQSSVVGRRSSDALGLPAAGDGGREDDETAALLTAHHRPEPRVEYGRALVEAGASAAMDLSDGLWGDLAKICARSGVGARVEEAALPVPAAVRRRFPDRWLDLATRGGEDYELLFTLDAPALERLGKRCRALGLPTPAPIGTILPSPPSGGPIVLRRADGTEASVAGGAFDHFGGV